MDLSELTMREANQFSQLVIRIHFPCHIHVIFGAWTSQPIMHQRKTCLDISKTTF